MADSNVGAEKPAASANLAIQAGAGRHNSVSSAWVTLQHELFRVLWIASVASNIGTMMQEVGASWLMTQLAPSPLMVSLIQTAGALPVFLLSFAAGALADIVDRRRLLIFSQSWMLGAAAGLGILTVFHLTSPLLLLTFTFLLGLGNALNGPAWEAIVPELVPRAEVGAAVSINSVGFNVARAAGPALGGLVVAAAGSGAVFLLNAASFLGVIVVLYRWRRKPRKSVLPAERVVGAMRAGWRYVAHAPSIRSVLIRMSLFMLGASAFWGLVPLFARQNLGRGAAGYGVLLGFFGSGAVIGGSILPRLQRRLGIKRLLRATTLLNAGALALMAVWRHFPVACAADFRRRVCLDHRIFHLQHQYSTQHARPGYAVALWHFISSPISPRWARAVPSGAPSLSMWASLERSSLLPWRWRWASSWRLAIRSASAKGLTSNPHLDPDRSW